MWRYFPSKSCGYFSNINSPIDPRDAKKIPRDKIVYLCTGSQGEPRGAMNRICNQDHPDVEITSDDTVIFSSRIIPGNEKKLFAMHNLLVRRRINVISEENAFIHVSGHPGREEMHEMYNWIRPEISVPVHGEHRHLKGHYEFAKDKKINQPVLIENGDVLKIFPGKAEVIDKVNSGKLLVDGNRLIDEESSSLRDRRNISFNGMMDISLIVSKNGDIDRSPLINLRGLPLDNVELNEIKYEIEDKIFDICKSYSLNNKKQEINLIDNLRNSLKRIIQNRLSKNPLLISILLGYNVINWVICSFCYLMVVNIIYDFAKRYQFQKDKDFVVKVLILGSFKSKYYKKLIITTAITSILFAIIYFLNYFDILNIRRILS